MAIKVRIPSPLRSYTNGVDVVEADGDTVAAVLSGVIANAAGWSSGCSRPRAS